MIKSSTIRNGYFGNKHDLGDLKSLVRSVNPSKEALLSFAQMNQTHSSNVKVVSLGGIYESDGIFTTEKNLVLAVQTADCMPILLKNNKFVAAVHIGWKGLSNNIFDTAIKKVGTDNLQVSIGPHAQKCCYEVQKDVASVFPESIEKKDNKLNLKLAENISNYCLENNIEMEVSEICTICANDYFSYREDKTKQRQYSFIWI